MSLTSREFADWLAFNRIEALGEERADLRMGILASTVLAPHMGKGKKPPAPSKFMPYYQPPAQTPDQIHALMARAIAGAKRGKHRSKSRN